MRADLQRKVLLQHEIRRDHVEFGQPEEWVRHLNQWDIPAIFGLDPALSPMDVKLEKHGRRAPARCGRAFATMASVIAAVVSDTSWGNLVSNRILHHPEQPRMAVQAVVTVAPTRAATRPGRRKVFGKETFGLFLPVSVPFLFGSPEAKAEGWGSPVGQDDTAMVPAWARLIAMYGQGVTLCRWVRVAAVFADHRVVHYRMIFLKDDCARVLARAAAWWLNNVPGGMSGEESAAIPSTGIDALDAVEGTQKILDLCKTGARLTAELEAIEGRLRANNSAILSALGPKRAIVDATGTVRARVVQRPDLILADGTLPKNLPIRIVSPPPELIYEQG